MKEKEEKLEGLEQKAVENIRRVRGKSKTSEKI